jgi:nitroreductase
MDVMNAIYSRRAVRAFTAEPVQRSTIERLIDAAIQAPSAMNLQPWSFAVIEGAARITGYSAAAKRQFLATMAADGPEAQLRPQLEDPAFNIFHGAPCLMIVCAAAPTEQARHDCCLAAENLMLAAYDLGLGTCWIGLSMPWLQLPATQRDLGLPAGAVPVAPIVIGVPRSHPLPTSRRKPAVVWSPARTDR